MKKFFIAVVLIALPYICSAQTVNIHLKNGDVVNYNSADVDFVDFSAKAPSIEDELAKIKATYNGGAIMKINDLIRSGSQLNWSFVNGSSKNVILIGLQLINGKTNVTGSNLLSENVTVEAGKKVSYTTTIGILGIEQPKAKFTFLLENKEYTVEAEYKDFSF